MVASSFYAYVLMATKFCDRVYLAVAGLGLVLNILF